MRFKQIIENSTTTGSVASVTKPMMTQTRENTNVRGLKPVEQVMKGAKKKGPYANSITESKVNEDDLAEQDLIVIPGQGRLKRTGFVKHDLDQGEHEGHTLKNSLHTIARAASDLDKRLSVQSEFPEWVSEKIGAAKGMMVSVMDYLISSQEMQHDSETMSEGDYPDGSSIKTPGANDWQQQYQQAVMAVKNAKTQQEYEAASARAGSIKDLLASKGIKVGAVLGQQTVAENYPKHQDLSGISTDKLKAYITKQGQQQVSGEGNQVKRVRAELERRMKGVAEGYDPVESNYQHWEDILVKDGYRYDPSGADALELVVGHQRMSDPAEVASIIRNILTYVKQNRQVLGKAVSDRKTVKDAIIDIRNEYPRQYQAAQQPQGVAEGYKKK